MSNYDRNNYICHKYFNLEMMKQKFLVRKSHGFLFYFIIFPDFLLPNLSVFLSHDIGFFLFFLFFLALPYNLMHFVNVFLSFFLSFFLSLKMIPSLRFDSRLF